MKNNVTPSGPVTARRKLYRKGRLCPDKRTETVLVYRDGAWRCRDCGAVLNEPSPWIGDR